MQLIHNFIFWYLGLGTKIGWPLFVFIGMTLESTFFPLPSEFVVPPAGFDSKSLFAVVMIILCGTGGSVAGGLINYGLACYLGRPFFEKYGKYLLVNAKRLEQMDRFWARYGEASTFIGRVVPGVRHLISLPAGMARMSLSKFIFYTGIGSGMWVTVLALIGWYFHVMFPTMTLADFDAWSREQLKSDMMPWLGAAIAAMIACYVGWVVWRRKRAATEIQ
ncbi:DedA family protein [bacterium]|nr:DedA family protein [bacterium]